MLMSGNQFVGKTTRNDIQGKTSILSLSGRLGWRRLKRIAGDLLEILIDDRWKNREVAKWRVYVDQ